MRALFLFIISFNLFAGEITCENGGCNPSINNLGISLGEGLTESYISIEGNNEDLTIKANEKTSPRNIKLHLNKNLGNNLNIELSSSKENNDAADAMVFADHIGDLNLVSNGKNGVDSLASSVLCAQKIMNGDMGEDVKTNFLNLRANDSSIPEDRCVAKDFDYIRNTKYACQEGFPELPDATLKTTRWLKKKRCSGGAERKMCVEKKVRIKCKWLAAYVDGCGKTPPPNFSDVVWQYDSALCKDGSSGFYADRPDIIKTEKWLKEQKAEGYSDEVICNIATDRVGKLNAHYKNSMVSKIINQNDMNSGEYVKQEAVTYNPINNKFYLNMYWGRFWGYAKNGRDVIPDTYIPPDFKVIRHVKHRSCYEGYSKYNYHLKALMDMSCDNPFSRREAFSFYSYGLFDGTYSYSEKYARAGEFELVNYDCTGMHGCESREINYLISCDAYQDAYSCECSDNCGWFPNGIPQFRAKYFLLRKQVYNITNPGKWSDGDEPTAFHHYNDGEHYATAQSYMRCFKSGNDIPCRFTFNSGYQMEDDRLCRPQHVLDHVLDSDPCYVTVAPNPYINQLRTTWNPEASSRAWQVVFEVMSPTGNIVEIFQKRGEGCW